MQTGAVIMGFVMMMVLHPEAQRRAQAEIDAVVGPHRLPDLEDRPNLPFIDCIIKETTRIGPPLEIGEYVASWPNSVSETIIRHPPCLDQGRRLQGHAHS